MDVPIESTYDREQFRGTVASPISGSDILGLSTRPFQVHVPSIRFFLVPLISSLLRLKFDGLFSSLKRGSHQKKIKNQGNEDERRLQ